MNSIGTLFIDCPEQKNNNSFENVKELSEEEYVKMLREYSSTIGVSSRKKETSKHYAIYDSNDFNENETYVNTPVRIYDINGNQCDIKELYKIQKNGMGIIIIEIIEDELDENFELEFNFWRKDSMNINNDSQISKDERIRFLPIKDLKFEIDEHVFMFYGCKMYCEYDKFKVALIIQNVKEI